MRKLGIRHILFIMALAMPAALPDSAEARIFVGVGLGCCGAYPGYYSPYYYPGYYYAAPPVVYSVPPPPPPVIYVSPPATPANQTSETYVDAAGRTCRQFQSASSSGTACLQPDGTWRTVP